MHRDALLGLIAQTIDQTIVRPAPLAHTVSRAQLRSRAVTRNEATANEMPPIGEVEPLDTDLTPQLSPHLVAAVIALLLIVFVAVVHSR